MASALLAVSWMSPVPDPTAPSFSLLAREEWKFWTEHDSLAKLISRMQKLPTLPALYVEMQSELAKPDASIECVGALISKDPAMTAKILRLVNSAVFGLSAKVCVPAEAVIYLGVARTTSLILAAALTRDFEEIVCAHFSHEEFWQHSVAVGNFARVIALCETQDYRVADVAFTAGLLHDIGKLLLAANLPDLYGQIVSEAQRRALPIQQVEKEILGGNHGELGACLLGKWGLPGAILEAIAWHNCPAKSADQKFSALTAVHMANVFAHETSSTATGLLVGECDSGYLERLGLKAHCDFWREVCGLTGSS